jgi:hypothetical protein
MTNYRRKIEEEEDEDEHTSSAQQRHSLACSAFFYPPVTADWALAVVFKKLLAEQKFRRHLSSK